MLDKVKFAFKAIKDAMITNTLKVKRTFYNKREYDCFHSTTVQKTF